MTESMTDEQNISRYTRGFEWFLNVVRTKMSGRPWRRLGIFAYYDAPYIESDLLYLSPKQVMLAMASEIKQRDAAIVMVVDALERGEMGLNTRMGFDQFMELFDGIFPDAAKFYFGPKESERVWLHEYPSLKIPLQWLVSRPNRFAEVLSDASPVGENIGPGDAAFEDFTGMTEVLVEKLGPPTLTEEVLSKIKSVDASQYAGDAIDVVSFFVSPASAVTKGVKYLGKLVGIMRTRRKQDIKEIYNTWNERVRTGYAEENLRKFFDDTPDYESELMKAVKERRPVIIMIETRNTIYDVFLPLVLQQLVEQVGYTPPELPSRDEHEPVVLDADVSENGSEDSRETDDSSIDSTSEEKSTHHTSDSMAQVKDSKSSSDRFEGRPEVFLFIDAATHLSKFSRSFKFALKLPERYPNISVAASFFTETEPIPPALKDGVIEYMSERALVFDLHPHLFDTVTGNIPVSVKAWLMGELQKMEQIHSTGGVAFLDYYAPERKKWTLRVIERPEVRVVREIRGLLKRWKKH